MIAHERIASSGSLPQAFEFAGKEPDFATLVLDRHGRIVSCGEAAARMLGGRVNGLRGREAADFILGLSLGGTSVRYRSAYLDYLSTHSLWREVEVRDCEGGRHVAWFKLSPVVAEGQCLFLLAMRIMGDDGLPCSALAHDGGEP